MAAVKKRQVSFPQAVFEITLADAIADLILPPEVEPTDTWHFQVRDDVLEITRIRAPIEELVEPGPPGPAPQALAKKATRVR
jgi:hypothetical protein